MTKIFKVPFAATGDKTAVPDAVQSDGSVSYAQGYGFDYERPTDGTDPLAKVFPRRQYNAVLNDVTGALGEIQQNGLTIWQASGSPFPINALVRYNDKNWRSAIANNNSTPGANTDWEDVTSSIPSLILVDASASPITVNLPLSNASLGIVERIYRRSDITSNAAIIAASGTDRIMLDSVSSTAGVAQTELIFNGDYLRLRSDGAGKWWCVGQAPLPASIATGSIRVITVGTSTVTIPAVLRSGRKLARAAITGGGGGGGGSTNSTGAAAGGGGAGSTGLKLVDLTGISTISVTIGDGGAGGIANNSGASGQASSLGAIMSVAGGAGGPPSTGASTFSGAGGLSVTGADIAVPGGAGKFSLVQASLSTAGPGGDSYYSKGVSAPLVTGTSVQSIAGIAGTLGAGGSGSASYNASATGGKGGAGILTIDW